MHNFPLKANEEVFNALVLAYEQKHRFYHTKEHISACISHLDEVIYLTENQYEIELALWFHDAIYNPYSTKNELESAKWARRFLRDNNISSDINSRVYQLIMVTRHNTVPSTVDESILVDIDLTILGAKPEVFSQYEKNIRKEYQWVPYSIYRNKRKKILEDFISKERLYINDYFYNKYEIQARKNILHSVNLL